MLFFFLHLIVIGKYGLPMESLIDLGPKGFVHAVEVWDGALSPDAVLAEYLQGVNPTDTRAVSDIVSVLQTAGSSLLPLLKQSQEQQKQQEQSKEKQRSKLFSFFAQQSQEARTQCQSYQER